MNGKPGWTWVACAVALELAGAGPNLARAEEPGLALNWVRLEGAESCISAAELMERLEAQAGRILFARTRDAELSIDGSVHKLNSPRGFMVVLEISERDGRVLGRRELGPLPGEDCRAIDAAVLLAIPLLLNPDGMLEPERLSPGLRDWLATLFDEDPDPNLPANTPGPAAASAPAPATRTIDPDEVKRPEAAARRPRGPIRAVLLDGSALAVLGQVPGLGFGAAVHAALALRLGVSFDLGLGLLPHATARSELGQLSFVLGYLTLAGCVDLHAAPFSFCGGAEYESLRASPSRFAQRAVASTRGTLAAVASAVLRAELGSSWYVRGALALALPLIRNDYVVDTSTGPRRIYRSGAAGGRAELGIGYRF